MDLYYSLCQFYNDLEVFLRLSEPFILENAISTLLLSRKHGSLFCADRPIEKWKISSPQGGGVSFSLAFRSFFLEDSPIHADIFVFILENIEPADTLKNLGFTLTHS
ncbi:hypothetical protein ACFE04_007382 [Oxalis oulophora]